MASPFFVCLFVYLEEGLDGRHMAVTFSSADLIHIITNLFDVDRKDCVRSEEIVTVPLDLRG